MISKLILENYIPLLSSGIKTIEIDLDNLVNLIIGVNGSGKSSIMKELNPLPPENANFKNGRKYVEIYHDAKFYVLDSYTHQGTGHSFKVGDDITKLEELNTGGTFTVQRELVKQHFGLDSNLVRSLTGIRIQDRFSNMSLARRKDLLLDIYPNNTDYALGVYNRLRVERNELRAVIKNQITRYTEENKKLEYITEVGTEQLEERVRDLEVDIKEALLLQGSLANVKEHKSLERVTEFNNLVQDLLNLKVFTHLSKEQLLQEKDRYSKLLYNANSKLTTINAIIANESTNLAGYEELLTDKDAFSNQLSQLQSDITNSTLKKQVHVTKLENCPLFNDEGVDFGNLVTHVEEFKNGIQNLALASSNEITLVEYQKKEQESIIVNNNLREVKGKIEDLEHKVKHIKNKEDINCPKCDNTFKVGVKPELLPRIEEALGRLYISKGNLETKLSTLNKELDNDREWYDGLSSLVTRTRRYNNRTMLELLKVYNIGKSPASILINALNSYVEIQTIESNYKLLVEELKLLEMRRAKFNDISLLQDSLEFIKQLEEDVVGLQVDINSYKEQIAYYDNLITNINTQERNLLRLNNLKQELYNNLENNAKLEYKQLIEKVITDLTTAKEGYLSNIIKNKSLAAVISNISDEIDKLKDRLVKVELLLNGLCPNKGLIGRLMGEFIENLVGNINNHLDDIWSDTLFIKPFTKDSSDLTYRFPIITGDYAPTPDISEGSLGQCDIIDLLFRFVSVEYVPYTFPLIIDEPGVNLDSVNRDKLFSWIKDYLSGNKTRQVFIVSHYLTSQLEFFNEPNVICIKKGDLEVPFKEVNDKVKITYV